MIECVDENIYYKKCKKNKPKKFIKFIIIILIVVAVYLYNHYVVFNLIVNQCEDYASLYSYNSINEAVLDTLSTNSYKDIVIIEKDNDNNISYISTDYYKVNILNKTVATRTESLLKEKLDNGFPISWTCFLGLSYFANLGSKVNYKAISISNVSCDFNDKFVSGGVNQTVHSLYIDVCCEVNIEFPLNSRKLAYKNSVLISESVIVGKIPDVYLTR